MVTDLHLKGNELLIYAIIHGFTQAENQKYSGSQQYLADWLGITKRSVINSLQSLVSKGLLIKEEVMVNGVRFYNYCTVFTGSEKFSLGGSEKSSHHNIDKHIKEERNIKERNFDRWWSAYPRKVNKQGAEKAFMKVDADIETMMAVLEKQKRSDQWTRDGGQFIPHPTTYLNQRRWEDEVAESKPTMNLLMRGLKRE